MTQYCCYFTWTWEDKVNDFKRKRRKNKGGETHGIDFSFGLIFEFILIQLTIKKEH